MSLWQAALALAIASVLPGCSSDESAAPKPVNPPSTDAASAVETGTSDSSASPDGGEIRDSGPGMTGTICVVSEQVGLVDDNSFVGKAWSGANKAKETYGWKAYLQEPDPADDTGYADAIDRCRTNHKADLIVLVGYMLEKATEAAADKYTTQKFQILDQPLNKPRDNVWAQIYAANEAAFLAGYVAAGTSSKAKVGTFGGTQILPVTDFMTGFIYGVRYYNKKNNANVQTVGWDPEGQIGEFTQDFVDQSKGAQVAQKFIAQGADVIFPVAGAVGFGAVNAVKVSSTAAEKKWVIGVDSDWMLPPLRYTDVALTSVMKNLDTSVLNAVKAIIDGQFVGGATKVSTLVDDGVSLGTMNDAISAKVKADLTDIKKGIIDKSIPTKPVAADQ